MSTIGSESIECKTAPCRVRTLGAAEERYSAAQVVLLRQDDVTYELLSPGMNQTPNVFECLGTDGDRKAVRETKRKKGGLRGK